MNKNIQLLLGCLVSFALGVAATNTFLSAAKALQAVKLYIPLPSEVGKVILLRYNNDKLYWEEGEDVEWLETSAEEFKIFDQRISRIITKQD